MRLELLNEPFVTEQDNDNNKRGEQAGKFAYFTIDGTGKSDQQKRCNPWDKRNLSWARDEVIRKDGKKVSRLATRSHRYKRRAQKDQDEWQLLFPNATRLPDSGACCA